MDSLVTTEKPAAGVALVTLNRPRKHNALSAALLEEFTATFTALNADDEIRAVVLTGTDPAFCAGIDLVELESSPDAFGPDSISALLSMTKPVIGAINGSAITGGLEIALACDFRIAGPQARFADTHSRVGVVPAWGLTPRLLQAVGQSWARQMSFTGNFVDAATALRIGLVNEVVEHSALIDRAVELASAITSTIAGTQRTVRDLYEVSRLGTAADGHAAEAAAGGGRLSIAAPDELAARRADVMARAKDQKS